MYTLYHSELLQAAAEASSMDIVRRNISLPNYTELVSPLISPVTGSPIQDNPSSTLGNVIISMILVQPVNFDCVLETLNSRVPASSSVIYVLNVGPGIALARTVARSVTAALGGNVSVRVVEAKPDAHTSVVRTSHTHIPEPVAIVGMAVNLPGADSLEALWSVLENGLNTISEVSMLRCSCSHGR